MPHINPASLALTIFGLLLSSVANGDESDILRARAAAAIAIHHAMQKSDRPRPPGSIESTPRPAQKTTPEPPRRPEQKSVVTMYTATWCAPCRQAKAELQGAKLPFDLRYQDVSNGGQPDWCESIPAFAWNANGQTRYVLGFPGVAQLIETWKQTLKK